MIDATEALKIGLVNEVVAPDQVRDRALAVARDVAKASREVLVNTKAKIVRRAAIAFTTTLEL
jgi:enoyl-CoA hydratase/carnithine racemase